MRLVWLLSLAIFFAASCKEDDALFSIVSTGDTHINFSNTVKEDSQINMINYEYLYNGGGVGIGDFNNDKKPDIYFTSGLDGNRMYLNKGNFHFEDVTNAAGVWGEKRWSRGVSVVDINNDGLDDIYVCAAVWQTPEERKNLLYINQGVDVSTGIPHFKEMSKQYGLDDTTATQMAAFFDYDNDGDLDVYLLVNDLTHETPNNFRKIRTDGSAYNTDRLYRNDWHKLLLHPVFTNVSKDAGITWEGYGLGVNICDINKDGWKDIFVSNDYLSGDLLYINNGYSPPRSGEGRGVVTFTNRTKEYFKHTSLNAMGNDVADINNDGLADIVETDMAAEDNYRSKMMMNPVDYNWYLYTKMYDFPYQTVRNTLQMNMGARISEGDSIGSPIFSETGYYSGITYTDWSWAPLLMDADQDGFKDLMVTNGLPKDITDLDFIAYRDQTSSATVTDMLLKLPEVKLSNYIFRNNGDATFKNYTKQWGWDFPTFSAGIAYADLDADGDMDVIINNTNMPATILENKINEKKNIPHNYLRIKFRGDTANINGIGTIADIYYNSKHQTAELTPYRGYMSTVENVLHFGLGADSLVDSVVVTWQSGKRDVIKNVKVNRTMLVSRTSTAQDYVFPKPGIAAGNWFSDITAKAGIYYYNQENDFVDFNIQRSLPHKFSQFGPALAAADINADSLMDFVVGGNSVQKAFVYLQNASGNFSAKYLTDDTASQKNYDAGICLFDADNDGDPDMYIASGGYEFSKADAQYADHFFINNGKGKFTDASQLIPHNTASKSCVKAADFDGDGYLDLFVGGRVQPGSYPLPESGYILKNNFRDSKLQFTDVTSKVSPELKNIGLITDAIWTDIDNDNDADLIVTGEWMSISVFRNDMGILKKTTTGLENEKGWWNSIAAADVDNDGDMDYITGNYGLNGYYKAGSSTPVNIYAKDYDGNGHTDMLLSQWRAEKPNGDAKEFPASLRDMVTDELPVVKKHFSTYRAYAKATMDDVLKNFNRDGELKLSATNFQTAWMENKGNFTFQLHALPAMAQWSPVYGIAVNDFNADGNTDIIISGNEYGNAPVNGRSDALNGLLLQGDGAGNFTPLNILQSGIIIPGNGKALIQFPSAKNIAVAAAQNGGALKLFRCNASAQNILLHTDEIYAITELKNGKKRREEFYYGSSFLSQSARFISLNASVKSVTIFNSKGQSRKLLP